MTQFPAWARLFLFFTVLTFWWTFFLDVLREWRIDKRLDSLEKSVGTVDSHTNSLFATGNSLARETQSLRDRVAALEKHKDQGGEFSEGDFHY